MSHPTFRLFTSAAICAAAVSSASSALAGLAWTTGSYTPADWTPTANNVLAGLSATMTGSWYEESGLGKSVAKFTDGSVPGATYDASKVAALKDNATLAWSFPATALSNIKIYSRWENGGRDGINISKVEVKVSGSDSWVDLSAPALAYGTKAVDGNNASAGALKAVLAQSDGSSIADYATALRLTFGAQDNGGTGYVEIEADSTSVLPPTILSDAFAYSGANQFVSFSHRKFLEFSAATNATEIGEYAFTVTPAAGYTWVDKTTDPIAYVWRILPAQVSGSTPTTYAGSDVTAEHAATDRVGGLSWTGATRAYSIGDEVVLIYQDTANAGSFSLDNRWSAESRVLLVAGGGAGGYGDGNGKPSGGGGAGGMLTDESAVFEEGVYSITVGKGGAISTDWKTSGSNGGNSLLKKGTAELYRAIGGGAGGNSNGDNMGENYSNVAWGRNGGSGGGGTTYYDWWNKRGPGGTGVAGQGFAGGKANSKNNGSNDYYGGPAGGGGAGGEGVSPVYPRPDDNYYESGAGGVGRPSAITGETIFYAGGGAGGAYARWNSRTVNGGLGGGGSSSAEANAGVAKAASGAGVDGLGGGGAGMACAYHHAYSPSSTLCNSGRGGNGIVVVRFKLTETPICAGVTATGYAKMYNVGAETVIVFTNVNAKGSFKLPHKAKARVLVVAGGGPGGYNGGAQLVGAGGGAGGMLTNAAAGVAFKHGTYEVTVGKGGTPSTDRNVKGQNGGDSVITFGSTELYRAFGGGAGGNVNGDNRPACGTGSAGGSGGGGAVVFTGSFTGQPGGAGTVGQGHGGGSAINGISGSAEYRNAGGGGGAGQAGGVPGNEWRGGLGGNGLPCDITGEEVWYAGGGAGGCTTWGEEKSFAGGKGGGGSTFSYSKTSPYRVEAQSGTDGLGGGGAGGVGAYSLNQYVNPGRGGNGVVIVRIVEDLYKPGMVFLVR